MTIDARGKSGPLEADANNPASVRSNLENLFAALRPEIALAPERDDSLDDGFDTQTSGVE